MVLQCNWGRDFFLHGTYLWKTLTIFIYIFDWFYSIRYLTSFFYINHRLSLCAQVLMLFYLTDEVLSINPSATGFVFGAFNLPRKDWLTYPGGTHRHGELCYNFSFSDDLTQMVNFPTWIPTSDSHSPALLHFFFLTRVFVLQWLFLYWEILMMLLFQFPLTFLQTKMGVLLFIAQIVITLV